MLFCMVVLILTSSRSWTQQHTLNLIPFFQKNIMTIKKLLCIIFSHSQTSASVQTTTTYHITFSTTEPNQIKPKQTKSSYNSHFFTNRRDEDMSMWETKHPNSHRLRAQQEWTVSKQYAKFVPPKSTLASRLLVNLFFLLFYQIILI